VLIPPINGETAITAATNSPLLYREDPGDPFKAWDSSITFDYMPKQYITFRAEYDYRHAGVPYWTGKAGSRLRAGILVRLNFLFASNGASSGQTSLGAAEETSCGGGLSRLVWFPDLRKNESFIDCRFW